MMMFLATENINTSAIHHNTKRRYKLLVLVSLSQLLEVRYSEDAPALSMVLFRSSLASEASADGIRKQYANDRCQRHF